MMHADVDLLWVIHLCAHDGARGPPSGDLQVAGLNENHKL